MRKKSKLIVLLIVVTSVACNHIYKKYDEESFGTLSWENGQVVMFNPIIENPEIGYELKFGIRHIYGLEITSIDILVNVTSPTGIETNKSYTLNVKDSQGEYIGSCIGDVCDLESIVDESFTFDEVGEYKIAIAHNEPVDKIRGVLAVGLVIDEVD